MQNNQKYKVSFVSASIMEYIGIKTQPNDGITDSMFDAVSLRSGLDPGDPF